MDNIFQIFLCKEEYREENLRNQARYFENIKNSFLEFYPDYQYNLYTNVEAAKFVKSFSPEVRRAYWAFAPFAYRADLLRLCLVYEYGGWYFDISARPLFRYVPDKDFISRNDATTIYYNNNHAHIGHGNFENFVFYAKPKSKFLEMCIEKILANVRSRKHLPGLAVAGPDLISKVYADNKDYCRDNLIVAPFAHSTHAIGVDGKDFVYHKNREKLISGVEYLGFKGVNDYNYMASLGAIYSNPRNRPIIHKMTDIYEINYE